MRLQHILCCSRLHNKQWMEILGRLAQQCDKPWQENGRGSRYSARFEQHCFPGKSLWFLGRKRLVQSVLPSFVMLEFLDRKQVAESDISLFEREAKLWWRNRKIQTHSYNCTCSGLWDVDLSPYFCIVMIDVMISPHLKAEKVFWSLAKWMTHVLNHVNICADFQSKMSVWITSGAIFILTAWMHRLQLVISTIATGRQSLPCRWSCHC